MTNALVTQDVALLATASPDTARATDIARLVAYGPPAALSLETSQETVLIAYSGGETNVTADVTQASCMVAYYEGQPTTSRQNSWTFVLDGHRFYVLSLGPEGDWAYDTTTREWCKLVTSGFDGLNFTHGTMWGIRVMGGDSLYPYLYELDPDQPLDEGWREIVRVVTGGIATRGRSAVGVANFSLTASVADDAATDQPIILQFSDDNGVTWSDPLDMPLTDQGTQKLIWNSLGSFAQPGRIFMITDTAGPVRLDGADCVLVIGSGADSSQDQEGQHSR